MSTTSPTAPTSVPAKSTPPAKGIPARSSPAAKLQPKEHGAYAILAIPMVTSLLIAGLSVPGVCVAIASIAGFFAHEPLLVAWGHRGARAQRSTPAAKRQLIALLSLAFACGMIAMAVGSTAVRAALLGCAAVAMSTFLLAGAGQHRTLGAELWGVVGLTVPCVPILLAGDLTLGTTLAVWTTWLIGFTATTLAVRGVIAAQKRRSITIHLTGIATLICLMVILELLHHPLVITAVPMLAMTCYLLWQPPPAKYLKRVGWTLVSGTITTALGMVFLV